MIDKGVAEAGHPIDGALTVAHAFWHCAGVPQRAAKETRTYPVAARSSRVRWRKGMAVSERSYCWPLGHDGASRRAVASPAVVLSVRISTRARIAA